MRGRLKLTLIYFLLYNTLLNNLGLVGAQIGYFLNYSSGRKCTEPLTLFFILNEFEMYRWGTILHFPNTKTQIKLNLKVLCIISHLKKSTTYTIQWRVATIWRFYTPRRAQPLSATPGRVCERIARVEILPAREHLFVNRSRITWRVFIFDEQISLTKLK